MKTKCIALTETRNARWLFSLVGLAVMIMLMFSACATRAYVDQQVAAERGERVNSIRVLDSNAAKAIEGLGQMVEKTRDTLEETARKSTHDISILDSMGQTHARDINELKRNVSNLSASAARHDGKVGLLQKWAEGSDGQMTKVKNILGAHDTAIHGTKVQVAQVKATANAAAANTIALTRRVGVVETTHYNHNGSKAVLLKFDTCKLDKDGRVTDAGTKVLDGTKVIISDEVLPDLKNGKVGMQISGFADARPFVDAKGKELANSDALNAECAQARADAVYMHLVGSKASGLNDTKIVGMGKTMRFGKHNADRSAVVELVPAPVAAPAQPKQP